MNARYLDVVAGAVCAALAVTTPLSAQSWDYVGSLQFASGDGGLGVGSRALYAFSGLSFTSGRVRLSASLPLIWQETPSMVYLTGIEITSGQMMTGSSESLGVESGGVATDTTTDTRFGIGDPAGHLDFVALRQVGALPALRVTFDVKAPLGDKESGLSSGAWDWAAGVALSKFIAGTALFADVAYWVLGDTPEFDFENSLAFGAGVGRSIGGGRLGLLVSILGSTAIVPGYAPPVQATLGVSYLVALNQSVLASVALGLTDSSPDLSLSLGWMLGL